MIVEIITNLFKGVFVIPKNTKANNNHEHIQTIEELVSRDKGGMIISPQTGLHENVLVLDYNCGYTNLIVNHNLSYETVGLGYERSHIAAEVHTNTKQSGPEFSLWVPIPASHTILYLRLYALRVLGTTQNQGQ